MIQNFLSAAEDDHRVSHIHVSVYAALWKLWNEEGCPKEVKISMSGFKQRCKISSFNTFYRTLRDLHSYGYIEYCPSFNHNKGSRIRIIQINQLEKDSKNESA